MKVVKMISSEEALRQTLCAKEELAKKSIEDMLKTAEENLMQTIAVGYTKFSMEFPNKDDYLGPILKKHYESNGYKVSVETYEKHLGCPYVHERNDAATCTTDRFTISWDNNDNT